ncbi:hypothetical protein Ciccas_014570, partial [Cichlidogyrus casuarinus]
LTLVCCCASLLEGSSCVTPFTLTNSICFVMYGNENPATQFVSEEFVKCSAIGGRPPFLSELNALLLTGIPAVGYTKIFRLAAHFLFTRPDRLPDNTYTIYDLETKSLRPSDSFSQKQWGTFQSESFMKYVSLITHYYAWTITQVGCCTATYYRVCIRDPNFLPPRNPNTMMRYDRNQSPQNFDSNNHGLILTHSPKDYGMGHFLTNVPNRIVCHLYCHNDRVCVTVYYSASSKMCYK